MPAAGPPRRSYIVSLDNRKARGSGHERHEEILSAARALFLEHGIENVSTRQIAARVGISQTSLYLYFDTKEQMLDRLVQEAFQKFASAMRLLDARSSGALDYVRSAVPAYIRFGLENPDEYRLAFLLRDGRRQASPRSPDRPQPTGLAAFDVLQQRIADGVADGSLRRSAPPAVIAQSFWAAVHGLVALLLAYPDFPWAEREKLIAHHSELLLHGVVSPVDVPASVEPIRPRKQGPRSPRRR